MTSDVIDRGGFGLFDVLRAAVRLVNRRAAFAAGAALLLTTAAATGASAQTPADMPQHQHTPASAVGAWMFMQDGVVFGIFNHQGGPRGDTEFIAPGWWMGMASRTRGRQTLTFNGMLSLDPALVGRSGYGELFQAGESLNGVPIVDRQHPHDFFMQLSATWRVTLTSSTALTIGGGPAAEPTLGPIAFMHRASAAGLPFAPLGHHTLDSTHVSFGVIAASIDLGRWTVEGSAFNGREPDDQRWDLDLARMDSYAGRLWFRPTAEWAFQASTGFLREPEEWDHGSNVRRTTASGSWTRKYATGFTAVTAGWGMNDAHQRKQHAVFVEATTERSANSVFGRLESQEVELLKLIGVQGPVLPGEPDPHLATATVTALTMGAARRLLIWRGFEGALGGQVTVYGVPASLQPAYSQFPVSAQVFFRIRLPTGPMGRMWDHRMLGR